MIEAAVVARHRGEMETTSRHGCGFVAIELSAGIACLLLPVVMLVASLPTWSTRQHAASVIAREVVRQASRQWPLIDDNAADTLAHEIAGDLGIATNDIAVAVSENGSRGGQVHAVVTILMPALHIPGIGNVGAWHWSTTASVRIDDYRSR